MKQSLKGSLLVGISAFFFGSYGLWSRLMIGSFDGYSQAYVRGIILLLMLIPFGLYTKGFKKINPKDLIWFGIFSICAGFNQSPYFYGFTHLSIGTATLLFYLMFTISAYILGPIFFKEKLTKVKYGSLALAMLGLFIIYKFALLPDQIMPALATLLAGFMGGSEVVLSKKISSRYSQTQLLVSCFGVMAAGNAFLSFVFGGSIPTITNWIAWGGEIGYVFAMLLAMVTVLIGFKYLEPSVGGLIGLLEVIFAAIFGILFFGEHLTFQLVIGGICIIAAAGLSDGVSLVKQKLKKYS